jgi:hypothetical protein
LSAKYQSFQGSFNSASAEAIKELAGRSTALLGLRDGLFRACEAYSNCIIGDAAYALVLTRYGQLMTTLYLGQDVSGPTPPPSNETTNSPPIPSQTGGTQSPSAQQSGNVQTGGTDRTAWSPVTTGEVATTTAVATRDHESLPDPPPVNPGLRQVAWNNAGRISTESPELWVAAGANLESTASSGAGTATRDRSQQDFAQAVGGPPAAPAAAPRPAAAPPPAAPPAPAHLPGPAGAGSPPKTKATVKKQTTTTTGTQKPSGTSDNSAGSALRGMNSDYLGLDLNPAQMIHLVLVACIDEFDETRFAAYQHQRNDFLRTLCLNSALITPLLQKMVASIPAATGQRSR